MESSRRRLLTNLNRSLLLGGVLLCSTCALSDSGAEIYKAHCTACHGAHGHGDTVIGKNMKMRPLESEDVQAKSDEELEAIVAKGRNRMPAFGRKLSHQQIAEVVRYIRTLRK
jgi:mono/diheme cytochrome c family protein